MKNYKWETKHRKILSNNNLSKYYQHGDILWKLHNKSVEPIGKYFLNKKLIISHTPFKFIEKYVA